MQLNFSPAAFLARERFAATSRPVIREQHQKKRADLLAAAAKVEWVPEDYFRRAEMSEIFERVAPLEVDFGCGDGSFILAMAKRYPERNFLGTERMLGRVEKVCKAVVRARLANCRVLRLESFTPANGCFPWVAQASRTLPSLTRGRNATSRTPVVPGWS